MIEINLIPDVKQEFIRAQKVRNTAITFSVLIGMAAGGVVVVLALILGAQSLHESIVRQEIKKQYNTLSSVENIDNVLTIQHQLSKISTMHNNKSMDSRIFDVIAAINPPAPNDAKISNVRIDPSKSLLTIEGSAVNGYAATETLRKTILNTQMESVDDGKTVTIPLTSEVSIGETSYGESSDGGRVLRFVISFVYPDGMFDNTIQSFRIVTPTQRIDVTDSRSRVPQSIFSQQAKDIEGEDN